MSAAEILRRLIIGRHPRRTMLRAMMVALAASLIFGLVLRPAWIDGESMAPTIRNRTIRFALPLRYYRNDPQPGDIVLVRMAGRRIMYLKRVLAAGGERIEFRRGALLVNGQVRPEPYVQYQGDWTFDGIELADGEFFVAGDNRALPLHSHAAGVVRRERIAGGLWF